MARSKRLDSDADRGMIIRQMSFIEDLLVANGAQGDSALKKWKSIEDKLDAGLIRELSYLNGIRNKVSHNSQFLLTSNEIEAFRTRAKKAQEVLISKLDEDKQPHFQATSMALLSGKKSILMKALAVAALAGITLLGLLKSLM